MKNLILASTSTVYGKPYLTYLFPELEKLFQGIDEIIFIPYARPGGISHDDYTETARKAFRQIDKEITGIHTFSNPVQALKNAQGIFTGGGNTFVLLNALHKNGIFNTLRSVILSGTPYLGTSAGSNICGVNIMTTNDMPIAYPPSFEGLHIIPFNINPHYIEAPESTTHMGETRKMRIEEFLAFHDIPVAGIPEGAWISVAKDGIYTGGKAATHWFERNMPSMEISPGSCLYRQSEKQF